MSNIYLSKVDELRQEHIRKQPLIDRLIVTKRYMESNYADKLDLEKLAKNTALSKFHFIRQFRKYYGRTPHQFLKDVRVGAAKKLLQEGMKVSEACYHVGFESPTSFSVLFKEMTGFSPSDFGKKEQFPRA